MNTKSRIACEGSRDGEFFGTDAHIAGMKAAVGLWRSLKDNPGYGYNGRMIAVAGRPGADLEELALLVRFQRYGSCHFFPEREYGGLAARIAGRGWVPARWEQLEAVGNRRRASDRAQGRADVAFGTVGPATPPEKIREINEVQIRCGVMPLPGRTMRGSGPAGICIYAEDCSGRVVSAGASYLCFHRRSAFAGTAFWGMLATDEQHRGRRIAESLGDRLMEHMETVHGVRRFFTGVRTNNLASRNLCERLGFRSSQYVFVGASDPSAFGPAPVTR